MSGRRRVRIAWRERNGSGWGNGEYGDYHQRKMAMDDVARRYPEIEHWLVPEPPPYAAPSEREVMSPTEGTGR